MRQGQVETQAEDGTASRNITRAGYCFLCKVRSCRRHTGARGAVHKFYPPIQAKQACVACRSWQVNFCNLRQCKTSSARYVEFVLTCIPFASRVATTRTSVSQRDRRVPEAAHLYRGAHWPAGGTFLQRVTTPSHHFQRLRFYSLSQLEHLPECRVAQTTVVMRAIPKTR